MRETTINQTKYQIRGSKDERGGGRTQSDSGTGTLAL